MAHSMIAQHRMTEDAAMSEASKGNIAKLKRGEAMSIYLTGVLEATENQNRCAKVVSGRKDRSHGRIGKTLSTSNGGSFVCGHLYSVCALPVQFKGSCKPIPTNFDLSVVASNGGGESFESGELRDRTLVQVRYFVLAPHSSIRKRLIKIG
eukprot:GHVN01022463.1.p1 GENE.GHVN01022463.1~~GHVN01022463.1.p1  ORF type:complete len:151 (+),score=19.56 GHVN01022463.1:700-1152(+)